MKFLQEAMKTYKRLDDEEEDRNRATPALSLDVDPQDDADNTEEGTPEDLALDDDLEAEANDADELPDLDEPAEEGNPGEEGDFDFDQGGGGSLGGGGAGGEAEGGGEQDPSMDGDTDPTLDGAAEDASEDPNRQGLIRAVPNAHLVYKREVEDGTFEELWVYNVSELKSSMEIRKAILAGTDIPTNKARSPDGSQTYDMWSAGNAEMLMIHGLQN